MLRHFSSLSPLLAGVLLTGASEAGDKISDKELHLEFENKIEPLLQDYCFDCHGDGSKKGDFTLDGLSDADNILSDKHGWVRIWENLRTEMMPPSKEEFQPTTKERKEIVAWIEKRIFNLDPNNPDPGRVTIRRMNREEYENTITDLVGVEFSANDNFPPDDTGFGFDTIGDVLNISPLLLEKYISAAGEIAGLALPEGAGKPTVVEIDPGNFRDRGGRQSARFMEGNDGHTVGATRHLETGGSYSLLVNYETESEGGTPEGQTAKWIIKIDGKVIREIEISYDDLRYTHFTERLDLPEGNHRFEFTIVPGETGEGPGTIGVGVRKFRLEHQGMPGSWEFFPKSYQQIFVDGLPPKVDAEQKKYMRKIVQNFAARAFRRPPREELVDQITALALSKTQEEGMKFVDGVRLAVTATLASPSFLFRSEVQAEPDNPGKVVPLDEYALASRLSYFLWSSAPDETLLQLAEKGELRKNLRPQVDRMLADVKSMRMVENFVGQWLQARDLRGRPIDHRRVLRERDRRKANRIFNDGTRRDMKIETERFFQHVLVQNRPVLELLNANYSFLNEDLAEFYGVRGVRGRDFRRVEFDDSVKGRGGLLGQGTFLIVTSNATRTSPVNRGLFVLDNILGTPAPPAPPDVPELEEMEEKLHHGATMRELMELHRKKPLCASCHERMDPIGLALENFNALGQWRDKADGQEIDSAGKLVTGEEFSNVMELKTILASSRKHDFLRCLSERILTYAIGRGVEYYDATTIANILSQLENEGGGMKNLIYAIVESTPFQKRRGDGQKF
ncbi:MAG: DUF1592 domain-containing protein [Akkermansiaceae bacterium]